MFLFESLLYHFVCLLLFFFFFFFSRRRRHTSSLCDWSSAVCSSDLCFSTSPSRFRSTATLPGRGCSSKRPSRFAAPCSGNTRSEERRVGKEGRAGRSPSQYEEDHKREGEGSQRTMMARRERTRVVEA